MEPSLENQVGSQAEKRYAWLVRRAFPVWLKAVRREEFPVFFSNGSLVRTRLEFAKITTLKKWLFLDAHTLVCLRNLDCHNHISHSYKSQAWISGNISASPLSISTQTQSPEYSYSFIVSSEFIFSFPFTLTFTTDPFLIFLLTSQSPRHCLNNCSGCPTSRLSALTTSPPQTTPIIPASKKTQKLAMQHCTKKCWLCQTDIGPNLNSAIN